MDTLIKTLKKRFGLSAFRSVQREVIEHVLGGGQRLVVLPTGGGKSLCYMLPACLLKGRTVVISPLIALMQDQLQRAASCGLNAVYWQGALTPQQLRKAELVFLSPEKACTPRVLKALKSLNIAHLVFDESHCIEMWGGSFRPAYTRAALLVEQLQPAGVSLFTATLDAGRQRSLLERMGMQDAQVFRLPADRVNIHYAVEQSAYPEAFAANLLRSTGFKAVVYCGTRHACEEAALLFCKYGLDAGVFHAGIPADERERLQQGFAANEFQVLCATSAFGMGVDISDIRAVLHLSFPDDLSAFLQESGRAGRDGAPALSLVIRGPEKKLRVPGPSGVYSAVCSALGDGWMSEQAFMAVLEEQCGDAVAVHTAAAYLLSREICACRYDENDGHELRLGHNWKHRLRRSAAAEVCRHKEQMEHIQSYLGGSRCRRAVLMEAFGEDATACSGCDCCGTVYETSLKAARDWQQHFALLMKALGPLSWEKRKNLYASHGLRHGQSLFCEHFCGKC